VAVLGVDDWRGAWVGALLDGRAVQLLALPDVAAVRAVPAVSVVAIDLPIGLSEDGVRACDVEARALLRATGAASSVFPSPARAVLTARDHAHGRKLSRAATGGQRAPSAQTSMLVAAIRALDACAAAWSARRIAEGAAECVGDGTPHSHGRPMRICW
jgi:predicted RNase H-like nuclease